MELDGFPQFLEAAEVHVGAENCWIPRIVV